MTCRKLHFEFRWIVLAMVAYAAAPILCPEALCPTAAADAVEEAFTKGGGAPWFDPDQDDVRPVPIRNKPPHAKHRFSSWSWTEQPARNATPAQWPDWIGTALTWLLGAALVALVVAIIYWIVRYLRQRQAPLPDAGPGEEWGEEKIQELPFELASRPSDFMAAAREAFESGQWRQAVILMYSEQLMHLDRFEWIRLAKGKSNRQYLREIRSFPELRQLLRESVWLFEDVYFGDHEPTPDEARTMWERTLELKKQYSHRPDLVGAMA